METEDTYRNDTYSIVARHRDNTTPQLIDSGLDWHAGHQLAVLATQAAHLPSDVLVTLSGVVARDDGWYVSVESEADTATIVARLNSYTGGDIWHDVISPLGLDDRATRMADPDDQGDVFVLEDARTFYNDLAAGGWRLD